MRARKNETAAQILDHVKKQPGATVESVAKALGLGGQNVGSTLLRLYRHSYVSRETVEAGKIVIDEE